MVATEEPRVTDLRLLHQLNAYSSMELTKSGTTMEVSELQVWNAPWPMLVTASGITIDERPEHCAKALFPMEVTASGISMETNPLWPLNAELPMATTDSGIIVFLQPETSVFVAVSMTALQPFLESYTALPASTTMLSMPEQPSKAVLASEVTDAGSVNEVRLLQLPNALAPRVVRALGSAIPFRL